MGGWVGQRGKTDEAREWKGLLEPQVLSAEQSREWEWGWDPLLTMREGRAPPREAEVSSCASLETRRRKLSTAGRTAADIRGTIPRMCISDSLRPPRAQASGTR